VSDARRRFKDTPRNPVLCLARSYSAWTQLLFIGLCDCGPAARLAGGVHGIVGQSHLLSQRDVLVP